jgi:hypothetical protein
MLARRFLWVVAGVIVLVFIGALSYRLLERQLLKTAMVPTVAFEEKAAPEPPLRYQEASSWIARPDIPGNPALWLPTGYEPPAPPENGAEAKAAKEEPEKAAVFFVHPTSFLDRSQWNAPINDAESQQRARLFVRHQASAFNGIGEVWAPKYRQAAFGAFLTTKQDAEKALDFAYGDVLAAFEAFLNQAEDNRPIILAAHSQGSLHLTTLLRDRIAGTPLAKRIVAAYVVGWPISMAADLELLGLPACEAAGQSGCILSWQSFGEPADPKMVTDVYDASVASNGKRRAGSKMLCVNPVTGTLGGEAPAQANLGTIIPNAELTEGELKASGVPARCDVSGFLLIGEDVPKLPPYVLPGKNYHVFDYALFWSNIRADAEARLKSFRAK